MSNNKFKVGDLVVEFVPTSKEEFLKLYGDETKVEEFKKGDRVLFLDKIEGTVTHVWKGYEGVQLQLDGSNAFVTICKNDIKKIEPNFKSGDKVWVKACVHHGSPDVGYSIHFVTDYGIVQNWHKISDIKARDDDV